MHKEETRAMKGFIASIPAAFLLFSEFQGSGTHQISSIILIFFGIFSLPWSILVFLFFACLIFFANYMSDQHSITQIKEIIELDGGFGVFIWLIYFSFVVGSHINGRLLCALISYRNSDVKK